MSKDKPIMLVAGATGSIGRYVVASGLAHGYAVRALVRDARKSDKFPPGTKIVVGDLTRKDTLSEAVAGVDAIVFTQAPMATRRLRRPLIMAASAMCSPRSTAGKRALPS